MTGLILFVALKEYPALVQAYQFGLGSQVVETVLRKLIKWCKFLK